jgi:hypothetical protein
MITFSGPLTMTDANGKTTTLHGSDGHFNIPLLESPADITNFADSQWSGEATIKSVRVHNLSPASVRFNMAFVGQSSGTFEGCEIAGIEKVPGGVSVRVIAHGPMTFRLPPKPAPVKMTRTIRRRLKRHLRAKIRAAKRWAAIEREIRANILRDAGDLNRRHWFKS